MPKTKISEYSVTNSSNTDIEGINIDEGCAPSGINNAIRELMVHLKEFQTGASGDAFTFAGGVLISGTANTITGNVLMSGTNTITGSTTATFAAGAVGTPSIAAHGDTNTGIFFPAADTIAFAEGGAEAMRIDSSGNVGIGSISPVGILQANASTPVITASQSATSVTADMLLGAFNAYSNDSSTTSSGGVGGIRVFASADYNTSQTPSYMAFYTHGAAANNATLLGNTTERMRITSTGNVGIGTTNPAAGSSGATRILNLAAGATAGTSSLTFGDLNAVAYVEAINGSSCALNINSGNYIAFGTGSPTERMRIDSSGNVGIGVTPSAWNTYKAVQLPGASFSGYSDGGGNNQAQVMANAIYDGAFKYVSTDEASRYVQVDGTHIWASAASGTAGNAITFTQVLAVNKDKSLALQGATSQTGTGITFPATQSASTDANTLDDYEEGTFTPSLVYSGTNTPSYFANGQRGIYTKIGRLVQVQIYFNWNENGSTGNITVSGLPFTSSGVSTGEHRAIASILSFGLTGLPVNISITGRMDIAATTIGLLLNDNAGTAFSATYTDGDQDLFITLTYTAA